MKQPSYHKHATAKQQGRVYITGAGPGDINLVTLRAKAVVEIADSIFYDNLVNPEILDWAAPGAQKICVGKLPYCSAITQETINQRMADHAELGRQVVRLKGGDPLLFGRGAEEAAFLKSRGIAFEIIPGVTSSLGAGAYAGIPLTHRDASQMVVLVTGHTKKGGGQESTIDWKSLAALDATIVFYMGLHTIHTIADNLIRFGKSANTPVAVIENGTFLHQRVISGNLADIASQVSAAAIKTPALVIAGEVVRYHQELNWFAQIQQQFQLQTA